MSGQHKQIGEVADLVGLSLRTIRYYEEMDLVVPSARSTGGFRLYTDADVARLQLIKRMKPLGFTLEETRDVLGILDALAGGARGRRREQLLVSLAEYGDSAQARVESIRVQLDHAEEFAQGLRDALAGHRTAEAGR